ncbi:transglutaminase-like domain-containing protein [Streptomyces bobili]|uniref:transglutaminase-like domain-containing protein n=1 Tax=Streptomyces bobili TaxID=67280 RepID=UPI003F4DDE0A
MVGHPGDRVRADGPARGLTITASSLVETTPPDELPAALPWPDVTARTADSRLLEFAHPTPRTTVPPKLLKKARKAAGLDPHGAATAVSALVAERGTYLPGVTTVNTSAAEAWEQGAGVCQDLAHLTLGLPRGLGLPTRYVSGYLHPEREAEPHRPVAGQSHARVEYWAGDWYGYDPTNRTRADESHVVVGRAATTTTSPRTRASTGAWRAARRR